MLLSFTAANHRSILEEQTLSLEATSGKSLEASRVKETEHGRILRSAAIYGPNASGKSNILSALAFMRSAVLDSMNIGAKDKVATLPFRLNLEASARPSHFECVFLSGETRYRYGFEVIAEAVESEWLMRIEATGREVTLFTRDKGALPKISEKDFPEGTPVIKAGRKLLRDTVLFVSLCAALDGPESKAVSAFFVSLRFLSGQSDEGVFLTTAEMLSDGKQNEALSEFARNADLGIRRLSSVLREPDVSQVNVAPEKSRDQFRVYVRELISEIKTHHPVYDDSGVVTGEVEFDLRKDGSEGTKKFITLSGPLFRAMEAGEVLLIDEFEARLHPMLTQALLKWFHGPANKGRAQLIFVTHDTLLMDPKFLRRDQIWFCDKDEMGATELFCLDEFDSQKVRNSTQFGRQYMLRLFGAVPDLMLNPPDGDVSSHD